MLYLAAVAIGVFLLSEPWQVAVAAVLHVALWIVVGLAPGRLARQVWKLWGFALLILVSYALVTNDPATDRWMVLSPLGFDVRVNVTGFFAGVTMVLRIVTVVLASQVARAGDPRAIAQGLARLGVPQMVALSIDTVLVLFGDTGKRPGGGGGGGRGKGGGGGGGGGGPGAAPGDGFWTSVKRMARGDVGPLVSRFEGHLDRAQAHAENELVASGSEPGTARERAQDIGVIAGVALTMLSIKALKVLPSIPFAPGHKGVILLPLYIVAGLLTRSRAGATMAGLTMGTVAFLMGDGRYGIFEVAKHVAPGIIVDLSLPLLMRDGRGPGPLGWSLFGAFLATGRFATIFVVVMAVQAPAVAFAVLVPGLTVHVVFGAVSGYVTYHLVTAVLAVKQRREAGPGTLITED